MKKFLLSRSAEEDLDEIWTRIARDSVETANRFLKALVDNFPLLADFPSMGPARDDLRPGIRCLPFKSYLIFYRPRGQHRVEVVRVIHAARDLSALFNQR